MHNKYNLDALQARKAELEQFCLQLKQAPFKSWPKDLEQQFWQRHSETTRDNTSRWFWGGLVTYFIFIIVIAPEDYAVLKSTPYFWHDLSRTILSGFNGFFTLLFFYILASRAQYRRWFYPASVFLVAWGIITVSLTLLTAESEPQRNQSMLLISFIYMLSFCLSGLQPRHMLMLGGLCALVIYLMLRYWQVEIFSMLFRRALLGSCILGYAMSCMLVAKERMLFIQGQLMQLNEKIQRIYASQFLYLSQQDDLTQISNRRSFDSSLARYYQQAQSLQQDLAILFIDVDCFKQYNDCYGHQKGDAVIFAVAKSIKDSIRHKDFVARYGGEEFVVLLPETDANGAYAVAGHICRAIERLNIQHAQSSVSDRVTISLGMTIYAGQNNYSQAQVLNTADQALYRAKQLGRNQIYYQPLSSANPPSASSDVAKSG